MVYRAVGFLAVIGLVLCFCAAAFQTTETAPPPTFYRDVLPILQTHCQSCHRPGEIAPMPFVTYEQTHPWAKQIAAAVQMKMMPPWFRSEEHRLNSSHQIISYAVFCLKKKTSSPLHTLHQHIC